MSTLVKRKKIFSKEVNETIVLHLIKENEAISQKDLSAKLGVSEASISRVISSLKRKNLVEVIDEGESTPKGGRKPKLLSIKNSGGYFIGVDINGFTVNIVITDLLHNIVACSEIRLSGDEDQKTLLSSIKNTLKELINNDVKDVRLIKGCVFSCPAVIAEDRKSVVFSSSVSALTGAKFYEFEEWLKSPIFVIDTASAWMLGARYFVPELKDKVLMNVFWGKDIGINILLSPAELITSPHKWVWDMGHITIQKDGLPCTCGNYGCLSAYVSGWAIIRDAERTLLHNKDTILERKIKNQGGRLRIEDIIEAALNGDKNAINIFKNAANTLGRCINPFIQFFRPDVVTFSGQVLKAGDMLLSSFKQGLFEKVDESFADNLKIMITGLDNYGGALGVTKILAHNIFKVPILEIFTV